MGLQMNQAEYIIGGLEACLCLVSLVQTIRIQCHTHNNTKKMLPKKLFHVIIVVAMLLKSTFFIIHPSLMRGTVWFPNALIVAWFEAAAFSLFLAFLALVLFWADFYDYLENGVAEPFFKRSRVRMFLGILFGFLGTLMGVFIVLLVIWRSDDVKLSQLQLIAEIVVAAMFLAAGFAYTVYGLRLASLLKRVRLASGSAIKVSLVASSIAMCFIARSVLVLHTLITIAFKSFHEGIDMTFDVPPAVELVYFFITEILPTILMLFFLRKVPRWKETSVPYKTIQYGP